MMNLFQTCCVLASLAGPSAAFGSASLSSRRSPLSFLSSAVPDDDILKPSYEVEPIPMRIGHGFDIHRMAPLQEAGQPIIIAGVVVDHIDQKWTDADGKYVEKGGIFETQLGVVAHSDGDVIYHSVVDAIFGALTLPDIGQVFKDTDPRWKGADSSKFMEHAFECMTGYGYKLGNLDVTLILERPYVAKFKPAMKENIVNLLRTDAGRVNIKARTHEKLDSAGELRSLSCHVVLTLHKSYMHPSNSYYGPEHSYSENDYGTIFVFAHSHSIVRRATFLVMHLINFFVNACLGVLIGLLACIALVLVVYAAMRLGCRKQHASEGSQGFIINSSADSSII